MPYRSVVLVKQVPDTKNISGNAMTPEGTINRAALPAVFNPEDLNALEMALQVRDRQGGEVIALSMGPPSAAEVLREALFRGADGAVLLSDRKFAGADTLATSYALACAVRAIEKERGKVDLVFAGRQAIDGDTAQVGPGIATRLGYTQLTLVDRIENLDPQKRLIRVRRKLEGRHEIVEAPLPVMITVVRELNRPRYPTVPMRLASGQAEISTWTNKVLQLDERTIGLKGSPTCVSRIFSPQRDKGEMIGDGLRDPKGTANLLIAKLLSKDLLPL